MFWQTGQQADIQSDRQTDWQNDQQYNRQTHTQLERQMSCNMTKPTKWLCTKRRLRSTWASTQSDQSLRMCSMGSWGPNVSSCGQRWLWSDWADAQADLVHPGWSESLLGAQIILFVLSWGGSYTHSKYSSSVMSFLFRVSSLTRDVNSFFSDWISSSLFFSSSISVFRLVLLEEAKCSYAYVLVKIRIP